MQWLDEVVAALRRLLGVREPVLVPVPVRVPVVRRRR